MTEEKKGFWKKLVEKLDKKMEIKAKQGGCCCSGSGSSKDQDKKSSCCS
jgi:hypothetical protein